MASSAGAKVGCGGAILAALIAVLTALFGLDLEPGAPSPRAPHASPTSSPSSTSEPSSAPLVLDEDALLRQARGNARLTSFTRAKKEIMDIHHDHAKTFYCGCDYTPDKQIDLEGCGYKVRKSASRAQRVEIEHVVPASAFGKKLSSWSSGHEDCVDGQGKAYKGRRCAERVSQLFKLMQADLHNLQPAIGEVNGDRSDRPMGEIPGEERAYGRCDVEISREFIEPRQAIRGDVARAYLYMDWAYPGFALLSQEQRVLFERWSAQDPPDAWERERAKRVQKIQGNPNPFIP